VLQIKKLRDSRSFRRARGRYLCEGPKLLEEALKWDAGVRTVVAAEGAALPALPGDVRLVTVPPSLLAAMADTKSPQGVLFLCETPPMAPPRTLTGRRYLVLDGVGDPGNLGTIWRTADAFGADGLFLLGSCADPWAPKTVRATMGAVFRMPVWETDLASLTALLRQAELPLYAAALRLDSVDVRQVDWSRAAAAIGSEARGLSPETIAASQGTVEIPMSPRCESLNAAAASTVILWEMFRS